MKTVFIYVNISKRVGDPDHGHWPRPAGPSRWTRHPSRPTSRTATIGTKRLKSGGQSMSALPEQGDLSRRCCPDRIARFSNR
jgi:hypothetical protein